MRLFLLLLAVVTFSGCSIPRLIILHDPLDARQHNDLGVAYEARGEKDLAEREYRRAAKLDPGWTLPWVNLGNLAAADALWDEAEERYRCALRLDPQQDAAMNNLAWVLLQQGDLDEAASRARAAVKLNPREPAFLDTLAAVEMARGRRKEALAAVEAALTLPATPPLAASLQEKRRQLSPAAGPAPIIVPDKQR